MQLPKFDFVQPRSLQEACSLLREYDGKAAALAGGTALVVDLRRKLCSPETVVGMKALSELNYVRDSGDGGLAIGAMTTLATLECSPLLADRYAAVAQATRLVGVPALRRVATIGGNLCLDTRCIYYNQSEFWRRARPTCFKAGGDVCHAVDGGRRCLATYQGDIAPALIALGAQMKLVGAAGERVIPLAQFYTGRGEKPNALEAGEILAEVQVPSAARWVAAYEKLRTREGMDFPSAGAAVSLKLDASGAVEQARVVLGAIAPSPVEVAEAAELLLGRKPDEALVDAVAQKAYERAHPVANMVVGAAYRRKMVKVLVRRAINRAIALA